MKMAALRLSVYAEASGKKELFAAYPDILSGNAVSEKTEELDKVYFDSFRYSGEDAGGQEQDWTAERFILLYQKIRPWEKAGLIAWTALEMAVLVRMNPSAASLIKELIPGHSDVTILFAGKIVQEKKDFSETDDFPLLREAFSRIELFLLAEYPTQDLLLCPLRADDRLLDYLAGGNDYELCGTGFLSCYKPREWKEPVFREKEVRALAELAERLRRFGSRHSVTVAVSGEKGSGRTYLIRRVADLLSCTLLEADAVFLGSMDALLFKFRILLREAVWSDLCIFVKNLPADRHSIAMLRIMVAEYEKALEERAGGMPIFFSTEEGVKPAAHLDGFVCVNSLKALSAEEAKAAWSFFSDKYLGKQCLPVKELAVKLRLPVGKIENVVKRLTGFPVSNDTGMIESREVFRLSYELLDDGRYDSIKRVTAGYSYDDLKLEEREKRIIRDICAQVEYRSLVMDEWKLKERYLYGACVSALFVGPPGTGKTMAAHVMAGILGLELFKVDLSQIIDKYIGETEKRLEEVFTRAEKSNMILFFDEADAVIGKRSEVKEANDRFANTQVAFLLQRMEEYDGIVILSSNYMQNIDAAFMRRIRFVVHFPLPNKEVRKEIWQSAFSDNVPCSNIDFEYLADQFEFSGGQIKNVVLNAAFLAAEENSPVDMRILVRALTLELGKENQVSFAATLGKYAGYLE